MVADRAGWILLGQSSTTAAPILETVDFCLRNWKSAEVGYSGLDIQVKPALALAAATFASVVVAVVVVVAAAATAPARSFSNPCRIPCAARPAQPECPNLNIQLRPISSFPHKSPPFRESAPRLWSSRRGESKRRGPDPNSGRETPRKTRIWIFRLSRPWTLI